MGYYDKKTYLPYEELEAIATSRLYALELVSDLSSGLLSEDGYARLEAYQYITDIFSETKTNEEFIEKAYEEYTAGKAIYESYSLNWKELYKRDWKVMQLLRQYVRHNFPPELREAYPEFARKEN